MGGFPMSRPNTRNIGSSSASARSSSPRKSNPNASKSALRVFVLRRSKLGGPALSGAASNAPPTGAAHGSLAARSNSSANTEDEFIFPFPDLGVRGSPRRSCSYASPHSSSSSSSESILRRVSGDPPGDANDVALAGVNGCNNTLIGDVVNAAVFFTADVDDRVDGRPTSTSIRAGAEGGVGVR
jgi:hypothetical protein